jgi:hypothetical protein
MFFNRKHNVIDEWISFNNVEMVIRSARYPDDKGNYSGMQSMHVMRRTIMNPKMVVLLPEG